jgi:mannose-1-phosphate guanylyltransferase
MAGGVGSRFWPLSTEKNPKQFLDILGTGKSLLQMAFNRFEQVIPKENIYILTNAGYEQKVIDQLMIDSTQVLCEPARKNTAPCIAYATAKIRKKDPNAVMIVSPADHLILNEKQFYLDLEAGINEANTSNNLVTFGIKPTRPDTGYGYIEFNQSESSAGSIQKVKQFREKPELEQAQEFLDKGNFYWNAGMFAWKASSIVESFKNHAKDLYDIFIENEEYYNTNEEYEFLTKAFSECQNISIDYAILENESNISLVLCSFDWSDLGTWGSLKSILEKDNQGNSKNLETVHLFNSKDCLVHSDNEKTIVIDGLNNFIVVETAEKLLILNAENEQKLKEYLKRITSE